VRSDGPRNGWLVLAALLATLPAANAALAAPAPPLDPYAYDYAAGCLHRTQTGTRALESWLLATRPRGASWGTESCRAIPVSARRLEAHEECLRNRERERHPELREKIACDPPRPSWSLHAEGRALDWRLDAAVAAERREGDRLVSLLLRPDASGAPHALARRMGIQEIIWNCSAWYAGAPAPGPYAPCFQVDGERRPGVDRTLAHRDHMHLGLNWAGARMRSSFWRPATR